MPEELLEQLALRDGDEVRVIVQDDSIHLSKIAAFLQLQGILENDATFDEAMNLLQGKWRKWQATGSA
jgi:antitoxin component of MazEF toxin-antitoxin module